MSVNARSDAADIIARTDHVMTLITCNYSDQYGRAALVCVQNQTFRNRLAFILLRASNKWRSGAFLSQASTLTYVMYPAGREIQRKGTHGASRGMWCFGVWAPQRDVARRRILHFMLFNIEVKTLPA